MKRLYFQFISLLLAVTLGVVQQSQAQKKEVPLVYQVENTGQKYQAPRFLAPSQQSRVQTLTNPFLWSKGVGEAKNLKQWTRRRAEIAHEIQHYEIGEKPVVPMDSIDARMDGDTLIVDVHVNGQVLTLRTPIYYPTEGNAPYPLMIGANHNSIPAKIFKERNIAMMVFYERQVNNYSQFGKPLGRGNYEFDRLYPDLVDNGAYSEWAWGFSRLLDGLQKLGPDVTKIDMAHIGVTGCSYAGKMALFCGAFDERVALTIAQEPGGGGAAAWRVSRMLGKVETLDRTDYNWFKESLKETFGEEKVAFLPYDHHELVAMCCPRALLLLGNPDYEWLADPSMYVSANAALRVWERFGIEDRMGYSIVAGHGHCQLPESQYPEVEAFVDKFLLGKTEVDTKVRIAPDTYSTQYDYRRWVSW
ncbi:MAG: hypothetical protein IJP82_09740 [Bacteroidaceae bacterium]|nr:hypothetical protein [Bacteroidaceae bacterium]